MINHHFLPNNLQRFPSQKLGLVRRETVQNFLPFPVSVYTLHIIAQSTVTLVHSENKLVLIKLESL